MEVLEPSSLRLRKSDKALAESLRRLLGERSVGAVLRRLLREAAEEHGLIETEQSVVADKSARRQAA